MWRLDQLWPFRRPKAEEVVAVSELGLVCHRCVDMIRAATDDPEPE